MTYMTNKIVAIQGNHPSELNPKSDTSIFLAVEAQNRKYKVFYYQPENLSIINDKVIASGYYIEFSYSNKTYFKIKKKQKLDLSKCKYLLIRQDPPFNLEYISTTYMLDRLKDKVKIINAYLEAPKKGFNTELMGKDLLHWSTILLDISKKGLEKRDVLNKSNENETKFLSHLERLIESKTTNADHMLKKFSKNENLNDLYDK